MRELTFLSRGTRCGAWYLPARPPEPGDGGRVPCVVMAHGFGVTRDSGLLPYAEVFAAAGLAVLLFDYRGFGTSDGTPRQYVSHLRQRQDWHAAVAAARGLPGVDPDRIALWGTSYSGGHVLAVAARDARVAAVVSQGAAVDGLAVLRKPERADPSAPKGKARRMLAAAARDLARAATGRAPVTVPAVGPPGAFAMLTDASTYADYLAMMGPTWRNEVCARSLLGVPVNRPVRSSRRIGCPVLFVVAEQDSIAPVSAVRAAAARIGARARVISFDCAHFDLYQGTVFDESVAAQRDFLRGVLRT